MEVPAGDEQGVVGVEVHVRNAILPALPLAGLRLAVTCARNVGRPEEAAAKFGAEQAFGEVDRMLDEIRARMRRGAFPRSRMEPAADDAEEAAQLADEAERLGVPVVVG